MPELSAQEAEAFVVAESYSEGLVWVVGNSRADEGGSRNLCGGCGCDCSPSRTVVGQVMYSSTLCNNFTLYVQTRVPTVEKPGEMKDL